LEVQRLALLVLQDLRDLAVDLPLAEGEVGVQREEVGLELADALVGEVLVNAVVGEEELVPEKKADKLVVVTQLETLLVSAVVQDVLIHHLPVVLALDVLDLAEVLPPTEGQVLSSHLCASFHELLP
jgi:hypothetical protein